MSRGLHQKTSKIEANQLGHIILDYLSKGWSYKEIIRDIRAKYDVEISKSAITRYLAKPDIVNERESYKELFKDHTSDTIQRIQRTLSSIRLAHSDINRLLNDSNLKPTNRSTLKKDIKVVIDNMLEEYAKIESTTMALMRASSDQVNNTNQLILQISNAIPSSARPHFCRYMAKKFPDIFPDWTGDNLKQSENERNEKPKKATYTGLKEQLMKHP